MLYLLYILFSCLQALLRTCWIHDLPNCISLFVIHIRNCLRPIFIIGGANNSLVGLIVCLWQLTFLSRCKLRLCIREPYLIIKSRIDSILHQHPCFKTIFQASVTFNIQSPILFLMIGFNPSTYLATCCPSISCRLFCSARCKNSAVYSFTFWEPREHLWSLWNKNWS